MPTPAELRKLVARGFTAFKTMPAKRRSSRYVESPAAVRYAAERFGELRQAAGDDVDIAIDFHGAISPALAKVLIKALEPHQPMFIEEPINCQDHDLMAEIARGTHLPIATGERVFTKWGFHVMGVWTKRQLDGQVGERHPPGRRSGGHFSDFFTSGAPVLGPFSRSKRRRAAFWSSVRICSRAVRSSVLSFFTWSSSAPILPA
jgi:Enolase C-terminal domain-like